MEERLAKQKKKDKKDEENLIMATTFKLIREFVDKAKTIEAIRPAYFEHLYDSDGNPVEGIFTGSMARAEENEVYSNGDNSKIVTLKNWFKNKIWYPKTVSKAVIHKKSDGTEVELEGLVNSINAELTGVETVTPAFSSGITGGNYTSVQKKSGIAYAQISFSSANAYALNRTTICTLPTGFRPKKNIFASLVTTTGIPTETSLLIGTNGVCEIYTNGTKLSANTSYMSSIVAFPVA